LACATTALAFYPGNRIGFSTVHLKSNDGKQTTFEQDHAIVPLCREFLFAKATLGESLLELLPYFLVRF
jgi:hypothetical protein